MTGSPSDDFVLRSAELFDGDGGPPIHVDVAVTGGRISAIGPHLSVRSREVDVSGLAVAPGFIDLHTHCDFTLPTFPRADSMVRQGVTTLVVGNCGHSTFPV